jgi:hypothetical protein
MSTLADLEAQAREAEPTMTPSTRGLWGLVRVVGDLWYMLFPLGLIVGGTAGITLADAAEVTAESLLALA